MAGLRDEVELDIAKALRQIDQLGAGLHQQASKFQHDLSRAFDALRTPISAHVNVDTSGVAGQLAAATSGADTTVDVAVEEHGADAAAAGLRKVDDAAAGAEAGVTDVNRSLKGLSALGGIFAGQRILQGTAQAINSAVGAASDLNEQVSASEVIFDSASPALQDFAAGAAQTMGLASDEALGFTNNLGGMLLAMGLTQQAASGLGQNLLQRAADLASFRNVSGGTAEVLERLNSGIVGEVEPLRRLGIVINEQQVAAKAMALGLADANGQLSESAKVQARIALIMEQSNIASGDFARTSDGLANSQRILKAEFRNVQIEFGQKLLPFFQAGVATVEDLLGVFSALPGPVQVLVLALVGLTAGAAGVGLLVASIQRLTAALAEAGIAAEVASVAIKGLTIGGGFLAAIGAVVGLMHLLGLETHNTTEEVKGLTRATDEQLVQQFKLLLTPAPKLVDRSNQIAPRGGRGAAVTFPDEKALADFNAQLSNFKEVAEENIGVAIRVRDALAAEGADVSALTAIIDTETAAQQRANETQAIAAGVAGQSAQAQSELAAAITATTAALDGILGGTLDAADAEQQLSQSIFDLAAALAEGKREGESLVEFNGRLATGTTDVVRSVESYVIAQAKAGKIGADQASVQAEVRRQLILTQAQFPQLRGELEQYIALLGPDVLPRDIETRLLLDTSSAQQAVIDYVAFLSRTIGAQNVDPVGAGLVVADNLARGIRSGIPGAAAAGADAGAAAAEAAAEAVETTLRRSAGSGLNVGGFLLEGVSLGARQAEVDLHNFINGMTRGLEGVVGTAAQISSQEAAEVLKAVEQMDQATLDLADARSTLGADSIEAKVAELALAEAQAHVNDVLAEALDSTKDYEAALKRVTDAVSAVTGSLRAMNQLQEARSSIKQAEEDARKATEALAGFDQRIGQTQQALADAQAAGDDLAARRAQATLNDLINRRAGAADRAAEAQGTLTSAQLDLLAAEQRIVDLGPQVQAAKGMWEGYLRSLATQAGLTKAEVDNLVASLDAASQFAVDTRNAVLTADPQMVNLPALGSAGSVTLSQTSVAGDSVGVKIEGDLVVQGSSDPVATADTIVDKFASLALT